jgi:hypothetical protein
MKNVEEIVERYLLENGYDGLYQQGECACKIGNIGPCDHLCLDCEPGYLTETPGGEHDYIIGPEKKDNGRG